MTNTQLYDRAKKVLESCVTPEQSNVGIKYLDLAQKAADDSWWNNFHELSLQHELRRIDMR